MSIQQLSSPRRDAVFRLPIFFPIMDISIMQTFIQKIERSIFVSQKKGSKVRQDILKFIEEFTQEHGYSPSVREISRCTHVGVGTVQYHLDVLEGHGYISRRENTSRSVRLLTPVSSQTNLNKLRNAVNLAARSRVEGIDALAEMLEGFQQGRVLSSSDWRTILEALAYPPEPSN